MTTWVLADTHFRDRNCVKFRPFGGLRQMEAAIVDNCNRLIKEQDTVYMLGDIASSRQGLEVAASINGKKKFALGNHDLLPLHIYDEILDASAVSAIYNSGTPIDITADSGDYDNSGDLTNLWNFTEGSGSTAADSVGSLDATLNGDAAFSTTTP